MWRSGAEPGGSQESLMGGTVWHLLLRFSLSCLFSLYDVHINEMISIMKAFKLICVNLNSPLLLRAIVGSECT